MSRPDSPLRNNLNDEETIKKLKLLLIKEKRANKENLKLISDFNAEIDCKSKENDLLIQQIQRLSETIGSLQDSESDYVNEINMLKNNILDINNKFADYETEKIEITEKTNKLTKHLQRICDYLLISNKIEDEDSLENIFGVIEEKLIKLNENIQSNEKVLKENNQLREEISHLSHCNEVKINDLRMENEKLISYINTTKANICCDLNVILKESHLNIQINDNENELNSFSENVLSCFKSLLSQYISQIESNGVLQDGLDKIILKCNDLEDKIANPSDKNKLIKLQVEIDLKDEQIKRLEELIEDNRNISRALETERDQLQNDLVDLRQRHEEKEGYLVEEYREAKHNLETYRIFNEKDSLNKIHEIERLQKVLDRYQRENDQEKNECQVCQKFELLMKNLKERFGVSNSFLPHERIVENIISEFDNQRELFTVHIERLEQNEEQLLKKLDKIHERIAIVEEISVKNNSPIKFSENSQEIELLRESTRKYREIEIENSHLIKENQKSLEIIQKLEEIMNIECFENPMIIIDYVNKYIIDLEFLSKQLDECKLKIVNENKENPIETIQELHSANNSYRKEIESLQQTLEEKKHIIESINAKILEIEQSQTSLIIEKNNLNNLIDNIKAILNIHNESDQAVIIDKVKNSFTKSIILTDSIDEYKIEIENIKQNHADLISEKESIINHLSNSQISDRYEEQITELQSMNVNDKKEIELLKNDIVKNNTLIETINIDLLNYKESNSNLTTAVENFSEIISKLATMLNINSKSVQYVIVDHVSRLLNQSEYLTNQINDYQLEIESAKTKCHNLTIENQTLIGKLEKIETNSGHDLMKLEMAEFDKTLINLNNQLLSKSSQIEDLEAVLLSKDRLISSIKDDLIAKETQNAFLDERSNKMKQLLVKTKRELSDCKSELENLKATNNSNNEQIELLINQLEEIKYQLSEVLNEKEKLIDHHATVLKRMETISKNKDIRLVDLRSRLDSTLNSNQLIQREFESYKIKAQTALSTQQRPKASFSNFMSTESLDNRNLEESDKKDLKKLITDLELVVKDLKLELQESDDNIFSLKNELDGLRWENEKWSDKYKLLAKENNELHQKYQQSVQEIQEIDKIQKNSYSTLIERYEAEKENLVKSYLNQIETIKLNFENQVSHMEIQIKELENDKIKYQEEIWNYREQLKNAENKNIQNNFNLDYQLSSTKNQSWPNNLKIPLEHERQQGEGMETTSELGDSDSPNNENFSTGMEIVRRSYNNALLVPLDKLLNSEETTNRMTEEQLYSLYTQIQSYKKKIEHLTEILNDSEATVSRLTEQAKILKSEIRRLEQNKDRESKLKDEPTHEYLKNVIMKFLDYDTKNDERGQLVPVIVTLLSLDSNEKEKLIIFSKIIQFDKKQNADGWYSYFNWAGNS